MIEIKMIATTDNWGRPGETIAWGYIDPMEVAALVPLRSRQIDGQYVQITQIVLRSSMVIEAAGTPGDINDMMIPEHRA